MQRKATTKSNDQTFDAPQFLANEDSQLQPKQVLPKFLQKVSLLIMKAVMKIDINKFLSEERIVRGEPGSGKGYHFWDKENFIDLGLPSKTLWGIFNLPENEISLSDAVEMFGNFLPTKEQVQELINECTWTFDRDKNGFYVNGKNRNSLFLPLKDNLFGFYHTRSIIDDRHYIALSIDEIHKDELFSSLMDQPANHDKAMTRMGWANAVSAWHSRHKNDPRYLTSDNEALFSLAQASDMAQTFYLQGRQDEKDGITEYDRLWQPTPKE